MQIAQVVPQIRTQKDAIFDYSIPPELLPEIKKGVLVEVPFHGRKIAGIVLKLQRKSSFISHLPTGKTGLKSLIRIIDPISVVDDTHIELAQWMADYYLAPLGKTLFENIVPPAKRIIQKISRRESMPISQKPVSQVARRPYLIVGNFKNRLNFYQKAIDQTLKQNKSVIILIPDLTMLHFFTTCFKVPFSAFHTKMPSTQRWLEWEKIRQGKVKIAIGSNSALFAPIQNLGLIIIDQEENETYKNERSPRFHAVKVAENLSKMTGANLVLGSLTPSIESYFKALKNFYQLKKITLKEKSKITVVDLDNKFQTISLPLQEKIEENLKARKKIFLLLNRKGEGTKYACLDCHWIAPCPKCDLPLIPQENQLICFHCQKHTLPPEKCPKCQSVHLKSFGLGTRKLEKFVKDFWPQVRVIRLEEGTNLNLKSTDWEIAIVTTYALKFNLPPIGLVAIIDADQNLNFPDFKSTEKNFQIIFKFLLRAEEGIIQTNFPENPMIAAAAQLNFEKFFLQELTVRQKNNFPPFVQLIRLLYRSKDEKEAERQTKKIYQFIKRIKEKQTTKFFIFGPAPAFFYKKRGFSRWQIIIKIPSKSKITNQLADFLKTLPKSWTVDVDPVNLL